MRLLLGGLQLSLVALRLVPAKGSPGWLPCWLLSLSLMTSWQARSGAPRERKVWGSWNERGLRCAATVVVHSMLICLTLPLRNSCAENEKDAICCASDWKLSTCTIWLEAALRNSSAPA